jgi:hypothetical protein
MPHEAKALNVLCTLSILLLAFHQVSSLQEGHTGEHGSEGMHCWHGCGSCQLNELGCC